MKRSGRIQRTKPLKRSQKPIARSPIRLSRSARAKRAQRRVFIDANRKAVFERDPVCRRCGGSNGDADHVHEVLTRAMLRGMDPEVIFRTSNTLRLCPNCHLNIITLGIENIVYSDPQRGCDALVTFEPRPPKPTPWKHT